METKELYEKIVCETKDYISRNFEKNITLNEIASKYHITSSYLSKIFKSVTGVTFRKYLYIYRINQAKNILISGKFNSIAQVSFSVGFNDVCYFYRVFNKLERMTPTYYIKKMHSGTKLKTMRQVTAL